MESLYHQTNKLIQQTQVQFQLLETRSGVTQNSEHIIQIEQEIQDKIQKINDNCSKLDVILYKTPLQQRQNAKMRVDQLKYDSQHLLAALNAARQKRIRRAQATSEREELLNRRFAPNPDITAINMDYGLQHHNSLQNANRELDTMLHTGTYTLESLRSQGVNLKGVQRRILDMANTLGLSNHTLRHIERRIKEDRYILMGGMCVTVIIVILVIIYFT